MHRNEQGWIQAYQAREAYWEHDGNPKRPHALLTSGKHSNGFFWSKPVTDDEGMLAEIALDLIEAFIMAGGDIEVIDGVVGPQTGATRLAMFLADEIAHHRGRPCFYISPAKQGEGVDKDIVFTEEQKARIAGKSVLICDDVMTTAGSVNKTEDSCFKAGAKPYGMVLLIVNRSGIGDTVGKKVISLVDKLFLTWDSKEECSLCSAGSEAIRPKGENWARLTAKY